MDTSLGKRIFGRPRRRWEDTIKVDLRETENGPYSCPMAGFVLAVLEHSDSTPVE
jgi:hypothetical protein